MRPSNDIIHELYDQLEHVRAEVIVHLENGADDGVIDQAECQLLQDIMIVYFLCDAGLVKIDGNQVFGAELFSDDCLNDGNLVANFRALVAGLEGNAAMQLGINGHAVQCIPVSVPLLSTRGTAEQEVVPFSINQDGGHAIIDMLNSFQWTIDEFAPADRDDVAIITPAMLADFFSIEATSSIRKKQGIYYTPRDIACYICKEITGDHLDMSSIVKILDPACGTGEFLLAMANVLLESKRKLLAVQDPGAIVDDLVLRSDILRQNIHGVDLMDAAVSIARKRLWLWALTGFKNGTMESEGVIHLADLTRNLQPGNALVGWLDENIERSGDIESINNQLAALFHREHGIAALADSELLEHLHPIHWRSEFPDGFDIIVGNPPYVFARGMSFTDLETACYKTWYLAGYSTQVRGKARQAGKMNAFGLFIARSMKLLKDHGKLGFIVPNTILRTTTNDKLRHFILDNALIKEIVDLQDGVFSDVTASTIIMMLEKKSTDEASSIVQVKHAVVDLLGGGYQHHEIDQARFLDNPACCFDIHVTSDFSAVFRAMKDDSFELGGITSEIIEGLVTRRGDALFTTDAKNPMARKMLRGKDIDRYTIHWRPGQYIIYDPAKLHRARPIHVHEAPVKLIAQRIGGGVYPLRVAYDDRQFYVFASINAIILTDSPIIDLIPYSYKYILACLNSTLMNAYYLLTFSNKSTLTVNVSKTFIELLPIKRASTQVQETMARLVDYILYLNEYHEERNDLIKLFDKEVLDGLIFEHYLVPERSSSLIGAVNHHVKGIDLASQDDDAILASIDEAASCMMKDENFKEAELSIHEQPAWPLLGELFEERLGKNSN